MDSKKLISELSSYKKTRSLTNSQIEADLGLPKNSLSNFLSFKKDVPKKWFQPIVDYILRGKAKSIAADIEKKVILGDLADKVTTADKIPEKSIFNTEEIEKRIKQLEWVSKVEEYCGKEGITPEDLILSHKDRFKAIKSKKGTDTSNSKEKSKESVKNETNVSYFLSDLRKKKCGL